MSSENTNRSGSITYSPSATLGQSTQSDFPSSHHTQSGLSSTHNTQTGLPPAHDATTLGGSSHTHTSNNLTNSSTSSSHPAANQTSVINPSTENEPLNAHHRPSVDAAAGGSSDVKALEGETTVRRTSLAQNAPGKAGDIGENALGAIGFGGASVERPKEDQGIGEKIAAFLGT